MQIKLVIVVVVVALGDPPTLRAVPTLCLCRPWQKTGRKAPSKTMKLFSAAFSHLHQGFINGYQTSWCYFNFSWELKQRRRQRQRKRHPKSEFMLFQISSLLLKIKICQMLAIFKKLNSRGLYLTSHKEKENYSCFVFTSFIKGDIRKFHVEVVQWWQRNFQKKPAARATLLCCQFKAIAFLPFSLPPTSSLLEGDVTRDDSQPRFLAQHSVAMLEQCWNHSKQCRNNIVVANSSV